MKTKNLILVILMLLASGVVLSQKIEYKNIDGVLVEVKDTVKYFSVYLKKEKVDLAKMNPGDTIWLYEPVEKNYRMSHYFHYTYDLVQTEAIVYIDGQLELLEEVKDVSRGIDEVAWFVILMIISLVLMIVSNIRNNNAVSVAAFAFAAFAFAFAAVAAFAAFAFAAVAAVAAFAFAAFAFAFAFAAVVAVADNNYKAGYIIFTVLYYISVVMFFGILYYPLIF